MGLVKEIVKEIGNKSREFYEFVLPPVDMYLSAENLKIIIDIPGFAKKDIELGLCKDILSIKAKKNTLKETDAESKLICSQRPSLIDKKIRLPIENRQDEETIESAIYQDGVLTITIPVAKTKKDASVE